MAKRKDAEDWLEWAQAKYDAAQERFAWSDRSDSPTMDSYSTLISLIESGMASRAKDKADDQKARAAVDEAAMQRFRDRRSSILNVPEARNHDGKLHRDHRERILR